jgi:signal transduction histidine kinase
MDNLLLVGLLSLVGGAILVATLVGVMVLHQRRLVASARRWGRRLLAAQDAERARIAADLHDDVVQRLTHAGMLAARGEAEAARTTIDTIAADLRSMARELHPAAIDRVALAQGLESLVREVATAAELQVRIRIESITEPSLEVKRAAYRMVQEGLRNAVNHAGASELELVVIPAEGGMLVELRDDGQGFDVGAAEADSFGLRTMRERVETLGGRFSITSADGEGTAISAVFGGR